MKLLSVVLGVLAMVALMSFSTATLTGCGDNPLDANDTVAADDLLPPGDPSVEIVSSTSAKIKFTGSNNESSFRGYVLLNASDTVVDSIKLTGVFSRDTFFTVVINRDVTKTWKVASFNNDGAVSTKKSITLTARTATTGVAVTKYATAATADGLNIDGSVTVAEVPDGVTSTYTTTPAIADLMVENRSQGGATLTPMNGAYLIAVANDGVILTTAQIDAAKAAVNDPGNLTGVAAVSGVTSAWIFKTGKSLRDNGVSTGATTRVSTGLSIILVSSSNAVARLAITGITGSDDATVTFTAHTPATANTVLLYKN